MMSLQSRINNASSDMFLQFGDPRFLFEKIGLVGLGSFGQVFKCENAVTGQIVAMKVVELEKIPTASFADVENEIKVMAACRCPQVVAYEQSYISANELWIIMEFVEGATLSELLQPGRFPDKHTRVTLREILRGVAYLHQNGIIHRDLKTGNVMVSAYGEVKISDFGVAAQLTLERSSRNTFCGTPIYMAPEVVLEHEYSFKADIWSIGIIAFELTTGLAPNYDFSMGQVLTRTVEDDPPQLTGDFNPLIQSFVNACLQKDPAKRASSHSLLRHSCVTVHDHTNILLEMMTEVVPQFVSMSDFDMMSPQQEQFHEEHIFWDFDSAVEPEEKKKKRRHAKESPHHKPHGELSATKLKKKRNPVSSSSSNLPASFPSSSSIASIASITSDLNTSCVDVHQKSRRKTEGKSATKDLSKKSHKRPKGGNIIVSDLISISIESIPSELTLAGRAKNKEASPSKRKPKRKDEQPHPEVDDVKTTIRASEDGISLSEELQAASPAQTKGESLLRRMPPAAEPSEPRMSTMSSHPSVEMASSMSICDKRISKVNISYQARRPSELSVSAGEVVKVNGMSSAKDLWVEAEVNGNVGLVPAAILNQGGDISLLKSGDIKKVAAKKSFEELLAEIPEITLPKTKKSRSSSFSRMFATIRNAFRRRP